MKLLNWLSIALYFNMFFCSISKDGAAKWQILQVSLDIWLILINKPLLDNIFLKKNWFIHDLETFWSDGHFAKRYLVLNIRFVVSYAFNTFCHNLLIKLNSFYWRINFLIILFYFNKFQVFAYINHFWISIIRIETCRYNME